MSPEKFPRESTKEDKHTAGYGDEVFDVYKLIDLSKELPAEVRPIEMLEGNKLNNYWHDKNGKWVGPHHILSLTETYTGSPNWNELAKNNPDLADIIRKIQEADLAHPILVVGKSTVIDGMHRLTKAWAEEREEVSVKKFDSLPRKARHDEQDQ